MWGRDQRGNNAPCSALSQLSVTSFTTHKQIGPFWCGFPGGWVCVHSRTLWVSPTNSPFRLGVSPATSIPTGFFQSDVLRLYFPVLGTYVVGSVSLPSCSSWFIHTQMWDRPLRQPPSRLPWSFSRCLASSHLYPCCLSPPFLLPSCPSG